jgi:hypothetical protein
VLHILALILLYFLPSIVGRHKHDAVGIFVVNLLFGWTVIGWIIAMVPVRLAFPSRRTFLSRLRPRGVTNYLELVVFLR